MTDADEPKSNNAAMRYLPIIAVAVIAAVVIAVLALTGGDDDDGDGGDAADGGDQPAADGTQSSTGEGTADSADADDSADDGDAADGDDSGDDGSTDGGADSAIEDPEVPPEVISWTQAQEEGLDVDFGERCDPETGRVKIPTFFAPECFAVYDGESGGATAPGVTGDTIKIVYYVPQETDPVLDYLTGAISNDDTNADLEDTMTSLLELYETYYETYGRSVDLSVFEASGTALDDVSARADAVQIAEELEPFMVWSGPILTNAFAEELTARGISCFNCGPTQQYQFYDDNAPLAHVIGKLPDQQARLVAEYIGKQLLGKPAIHAGDEAFQAQERVFGRLWINSSEASVANNEFFEEVFGELGGEIVESVDYALDPATIAEQANTAIGRLKAAGVTSIILSGDPVGPGDFTREATSQDYFPEWILTGTSLVDTNVYARSYDQEQWQHAFGVSNLSARTVPGIDGAREKYTWFFGEPPAADDTIGVMDFFPSTFYAVVQGVGLDLTAENYQAALFAGEPTQRAITAPSLSWGADGRWPEVPDYGGIDDITEIWWDTDLVGFDELDREAPGMYQFVDGGVRYLPGEIPERDTKAFDPDGAVAVYDDRPAEEASPDYEPLR
ncbi:MAG: hypothetical protein OES57_13445 [Acidimicrobiia bacterium]|nr:hypothetical protein [Acidimicrobiia bacterium]